MKRTLRRRVLSWMMGAGIAGAAILLLARSFAEDKAPPKPPPVPPNVVNPADFSKYGIEAPTKKILAGRTVPSSSEPGSASTFNNPKVQPGKVRWHKTFADACQAAKQSRKPVLLFQMMGKLDERFC